MARVPAGTYKLPNNGLPMYVEATGTATISSLAGVTVGVVSAGQIALFIPLSATIWAVAAHSALYTNATTTQGFVDLPLTSWREVVSNDITNAAGNGGVLATDSTPALEYVNGDTDSQIRILWAASNSDAVACQITLPPDLDRTQPIIFNARGGMSDAVDTPVLDLDTFFDQGDTKVEDATELFGLNVGTKTATIAAADIPAAAGTMSLEITPGAHTSDTLAIYATYITYTKKLLLT
jgi:hypothetical protein